MVSPQTIRALPMYARSRRLWTLLAMIAVVLGGGVVLNSFGVRTFGAERVSLSGSFLVSALFAMGTGLTLKTTLGDLEWTTARSRQRLSGLRAIHVGTAALVGASFLTFGGSRWPLDAAVYSSGYLALTGLEAAVVTSSLPIPSWTSTLTVVSANWLFGEGRDGQFGIWATLIHVHPMSLVVNVLVAAGGLTIWWLRGPFASGTAAGDP